jgi:hypothetical protein
LIVSRAKHSDTLFVAYSRFIFSRSLAVVNVSGSFADRRVLNNEGPTFLALRGDSFAAKEVLDGCVGKAAQLSELIDLERADNSQIDPGLLESEM